MIHLLTTLCEQCKAEIPYVARYCPECGYDHESVLVRCVCCRKLTKFEAVSGWSNSDKGIFICGLCEQEITALFRVIFS